MLFLSSGRKGITAKTSVLPPKTQKPKLGIFPLVLTVLNRDYRTPPAIMPVKDCYYKAEHPNLNLNPKP